MKVEYIPRRALYQIYALKTSFDQNKWSPQIEINKWLSP
jgi:hypothetical protein